jgi:hypothetical protein
MADPLRVQIEHRAGRTQANQGAPMTLRPRTIKLQKGDEVTLQYLGAALVLQWSELSEEVQKTILRQAMAVGGLPPLTSLNEQVRSLIWRTEENNA